MLALAAEGADGLLGVPYGQPRGHRGFGWDRRNKPLLYDTVGLFNGYRVRYRTG
jgi:hypothetical protein